MATTDIAPEQEASELFDERATRRAEPASPAGRLSAARLDGAVLRARATRAMAETFQLGRVVWLQQTIAANTGARPGDQRNMFELVAHDLTNSLAAAQLCVAGLAEPRRRPAIRSGDYVSLLRRSLHQMEDLVADLRDARQMMSGRFVIEAGRSISPASLVSTAIEGARSWVRERSLVPACAPALGPVRADERRVQRVFANLIGNAVKFTDRKGVITVGAVAGPSPGLVAFFVRDDGDGLSDAAQARIFEPFWQADRKHGGSGLGLTVCRGIRGARGTNHGDQPAGIGKHVHVHAAARRRVSARDTDVVAAIGRWRAIAARAHSGVASSSR